MPQIPERPSSSVRRLNPHLYGAEPGLDPCPDPVHGKPTGTLGRQTPPKPATQARHARRSPIVVALVAFTRQELDPDNLANAFKGVQDGVAQYLGLDDGDRRAIRWHYGNVRTSGPEGVLVVLPRQHIKIPYSGMNAPKGGS